MKQTLFFAGIIVVMAGLYGIMNREQMQAAQPAASVSPVTIAHAHGLAIDVLDSTTLYIATHHGLLALNNEKDLHRVGESHDDYMGFVVHPILATTFYTSGHPAQGGNLGVQTSVDKGLTWQKISDGGSPSGPVDFHAMAISLQDPQTLYGWFGGKVYRTQDGGTTWKIVSSDNPFVSLIASPTDAQKVYGVTPNKLGVLISEDGGVMWKSLSPQLEGGAVSMFTIDPNNDQHMLVFSERLNGLAQSVDAGKTWTSIPHDFGGAALLHAAYDKKYPRTLYVITHTNSIWKSIDGGLNFVQIFK